MMKNTTKVLMILGLVFAFACNKSKKVDKSTLLDIEGSNKYEKEEYKENEDYYNKKAIAVEERWLYEFNMQKNPITGEIPREEKQKEFENSLLQKRSFEFAAKTESSIISRGPSNLGGRTRAFKIDLSDETGNTMLAGGVSSGVFKTTNGGQNWVKVSPFDEIHNVTDIAQDPREGFQNIWYYATGEFRGNSARKGEFYYGNGIWKSTNGGATWEQIPQTDSEFGNYDSTFDLITDIEVHPITGDLYVGTADSFLRISGEEIVEEIEINTSNSRWVDVVITSSGRVYAAIDGRLSNNGIFTSETGIGNWERIAFNNNPEAWQARSRITLAIAPSNENFLYALYDNGITFDSDQPESEADLWRYDRESQTWTDFSDKMPDEPGGDSSGNDPFAHQGSYDLVISVKPDDENYVVIGGTNAYRIINIETSATFQRIGGYTSPISYGLYDTGGVEHHPDIHAFSWDLNDSSIMYSGTDGGVHKTENINAANVEWINLNNSYLTYQYYYVTLLNIEGSDVVMGGAQDNGTTIGGFDFGFDNSSEMSVFFGGDGVSVGLAPLQNGNDTQIIQYFGTQRGNMFRFSPQTGRTTLTPIDNDAADGPEPFPSNFVTYFYLDPSNPSTIYYASESTILRLNNANNASQNDWEEVGSILFQEEISAYEASKGDYDPATSYLLIGGENGRVYKLLDPINTESFSNASIVTPRGVITGNSGQYVSSMAVHPTNKDIAMVTYSSYGSNIRNIFITFNMTANSPSWVEVENNLESHSIRGSAIAEVDGEIIFYAGTARGLYKSTDPENENWSLVGGDVMGIPVISNLVYRNSDKKLLIGTHGNGMYEANLSDSSLSTDTFDTDFVDVVVYPNPVTYRLNFASNKIDLTDDTFYNIFDIRGREITSGKLTKKTVDVSALSQGSYIIRIKNGNTLYSKKFIKQ